MRAQAQVELKNLRLPTDLGTYGRGDVVPEAHLLDLTLGIDARHVLLEGDGMAGVFDYDPLIAEIDRLARDGHYETQEWLMTRILTACAAHPEIEAVTIALSKTPVRHDSGTLGVRLKMDAAQFAAFRDSVNA